MSVPHVLFFVEVLMVCVAAGLILIRSATPQLTGVGWVGAASAAGAIGPLALIFAPQWALPLTSIAILASLVAFHVAVLSASESKSKFPRFGILLILADAAAWLLLSKGLSHPWLGVIAADLFPAAQAAQTAWQVIIEGRVRGRAPSWLVSSILLLMTIFNVIRSSMLLFPESISIPGLSISDNTIYGVYLLAGIGLAFGFLWLTTIGLTMRLDEQGGRDPLTKALNRRHFLQSCEEERARTFRTGGCFSLMMVDIDHFKSINDTFGHSVGDTVICDVVDRIQDSVRGIDIVGRWGGEEFIVLVREQGKNSALQVAERMRSKVEAMDSSAAPIRYGNHRRITVSIGTATFKSDETIVQLVERADQALYRAKAAGRNCVVADHDATTAVTPRVKDTRTPQFSSASLRDKTASLLKG